jgi:hypothetical protein
MTRTRCFGAMVALGLLTSPTAGHAQTAGTQQFTIVRIDNRPAMVVAVGPIAGIGTEENTDSHGQSFPSTYHFAGGDVFSTVTPGRPSVTFDPTTCVTRVSETDAVRFTGVTGAYACASGTATASLQVVVVGVRTDAGTCAGPGSPPLFKIIIVRGTGTTSLGA